MKCTFSCNISNVDAIFYGTTATPIFAAFSYNTAMAISIGIVR